MMNPVLAERYAQVCAEDNDIHLHLPMLVAAVDEVNATTVIECGVRYGPSTVALLFALEGRGHLYSVDSSFPVAAPGSDVNLLDPQGPLGVLDFWHFILGQDEWPETQAMLPDICCILLVDTMHTYEQTSLELELYIPRVRSGGRAYFHDTALRETGNATTPQPLYPVKTAITEYCAAHGLEWTNTDECNGLACVMIP